jgi:capsular polysaccharide biosynthesis protein
MTKQYMSETRIKVKGKPASGWQTHGEIETFDLTLAQTESEVIRSELIMRKVIGNLNLNETWGKKYDVGNFKTLETLELLKHKTSIRPVPKTALIEIDAFDDNPNDAAIIANGIAKAYTDFVATNNGAVQAEVIDSAYANKFPAYPNKPFNYIVGALIGICLGFLAGATIAVIVFVKKRKVAEISES